MSEYTAADLVIAINTTWPTVGGKPRYVVAFEVHNGAGFAYGRRLDAVVFDTWPSGGLLLHGLEIKVTPGDFRRELQNTTKASDWTEHLDWFSIVAPPGVAKLDLMPEKWGLYQLCEGGKLKAKRKPLMLHDGGRIATINRTFAAAFCRALVDRSLSKEAEHAAFERGRKDAEYWGADRAMRAERKAESLEERLTAFENASGVSISDWPGAQKIGEAVQFVLRGGLDTKLGHASDLHVLAARIEQVACEMDHLRDATSLVVAL